MILEGNHVSSVYIKVSNTFDHDPNDSRTWILDVLLFRESVSANPLTAR